MALTVVKYRKTPTGETTATPAYIIRNKAQLPQIVKCPIIKLEGNTSLILKKIPASIRPSMKRSCSSITETIERQPKYALQALGNMQLAQTFACDNTILTSSDLADLRKEQQKLGDAISLLPPTTIIKATSRPMPGYSSTMPNMPCNNLQSQNSVNNARTAMTTPKTFIAMPMRPATVQFIKREEPSRTMRSMTLKLVENNPQLHLGVGKERLPVLKNTICTMTGVSHLDCYITLKKMRQNEPFALLADYFDFTESEVKKIFAVTITKLARYLRFLIRWPDSKHYYDRHKYMPFAYRAELAHVQSVIECVETDVDEMCNVKFSSYKYIYCISTSGIICYISDAYCGNCDDLMLLEATNFNYMKPDYLTLVSEPGKAVARRQGYTDNAKPLDEADDASITKYDAVRIATTLASTQTLSVVSGELTSSRARHTRVPTVKLPPESVCRSQIREMIDALREFRVLQHDAIRQTLLFEYLNEILIVAAALTNLQR